MCYAIIEFGFADGRNADSVRVDNEEALEETLGNFRTDERIVNIRVFKRTNTYARRVVWDET